MIWIITIVFISLAIYAIKYKRDKDAAEYPKTFHFQRFTRATGKMNEVKITVNNDAEEVNLWDKISSQDRVYQYIKINK